MPHLIFPIDADFYANRLQRAFARSWRERSLAPCHELCEELRPRIRQYHEDYRGLAEQTLVEQVGAGLSFDRATWRALVGEMLLFAACEVPLLEVPAPTWCWLLARAPAEIARAAFTPIHQALFGSRDLAFAAGYYRPDFAGYNAPEDVSRLDDFLRAVDPAIWQPDDLLPLATFPEKEDRADEMAYARQCWPPLVEVYRKARELGQMLVCEVV